MSPAFADNSKIAGASVAAPGAGASIASIVAPAEGVYSVKGLIALTGTAETSLRNVRLRENGNTIGDFLTLSGMPVTFDLDRVEVNPGGGNMDFVVIAAATAGSIYNVTLIATRIA